MAEQTETKTETKTETTAELRRRIRAQWDDICARAGVAGDDQPRLPIRDASLCLLGTGTKTEKGEAAGHITAIVYAAPAFSLWGSVERAAGRTLCPFATGRDARTEELTTSAGCIDFCLAEHSGRMPLAGVANARRWKAALLVGARGLFLSLLRAEVRAFEKSARRAGFVPVVRVDGGTDTGIGATLAPEFPEVRFYDYTKVGQRAFRFARGGYAPNYHLTFSLSGRNEAEARELLAAGVNVAVVFLGRIPATFLGVATFDADAHDLRFIDQARGGVAALTIKSLRRVDPNRARRGGFVVDADQDARASRD